MNWNAPKTSIVQVLFQFVYTVFQFIYKLFHSNSLNRQFGIIQENMNRCQFRNFVFRRLETDSSDVSPLNLDKARSDIISTCSANAGLTYTASLSTISYSGGNSWRYFASILTPDGVIYAIPRYTNYILRLDTNNDTCSTIAYGAQKRFNSAALSPDLKYLYLSPCNTTNMYKLDLSTNELILYGQLGSSSAEYKYFASITSSNGKIYMASPNGLGMLEINPSDDSYNVYVNGTSTVPSLDGYRVFLDKDGNILSTIGVNIYKFDIVAKTFTSIESTGYGYIDYNMGADGNYYGIGRYNGGTSSMPTLSWTGQFAGSITLSANAIRESALSCITPSGRVFYPPYSAGGSTFSIGLDGSYQAEPTIPTQTVTCTLAPNGSVYAFSTSSDIVYKISFSYSGGQAQMFKESTLLSPLLNRG